MNFKIAPFHFVEDEVRQILPEHYEVASKDGDYNPLDVDWDYYRQSSYEGKCFVILLVKKCGVVGYSVFFIDNDANSKSKLEAINSAIYIKEGHRGRASFLLLKESEKFAKAAGASKISYCIKVDKIGNFLNKNGYSPEYTTWSKEL